VRASGRIGSIRLVSSSGHVVLDDAAIEAAREWFFVPGSSGRKQTDVIARVPILFVLHR
jgi:protein TonB